MATPSKDEGSALMDGLQKQIDNLREIVISLDHNVRGNGRPGLKDDVSAIKITLEHMQEREKEFEGRILDTIRLGIIAERERVQEQLKDTGQIQAIAFPIAQKAAKDAVDEYRKEQEKQDSAPGTWRYFQEKLAIPVSTSVLMTIIGVVLTLFFQYIKSLP